MAFRKVVMLSLGLAALLSAGPARGAADVQENDAQAPPSSPRRPYLRVVLGDLAFLVVQAQWYWGHFEPSDSKIAPLSWETWRGKLFSSRYFVFDNDHFNTNAVGHPIAGTVYYHIARGNGLSAGTSFLTTFIASTAWKYFGEADQKLSTNDLIVTPVAGWVIGEATYRIGRYFADGEPTFANCLGAVLFSPVAAMNGVAVCQRGRREVPFDDEPGSSGRTWHRLSFELGAAHAVFDGVDARDEMALGIGARIIAHAFYGEPGSGVSTARPGQWSAIGARWFLEDGSIAGASVHANTLAIGRYLRSYSESVGAAGEADGQGLLLGLGSSFDYDARRVPTLWDRTCAVGLLGPMSEVSIRRGRLALRATFAASYAFAQVTSLAYARAAPEFANVVIKSVLQKQGYYFGQGLLAFAGLEAELGDVRFRLDGRSQSLWSFNRADDMQGRIQNNFSLRDTRLYLAAIAAFQPLGGPVRLVLELDEVHRDSHLPGTDVQSDERRTIGSIVLVL